MLQVIGFTGNYLLSIQYYDTIDIITLIYCLTI